MTNSESSHLGRVWEAKQSLCEELQHLMRVVNCADTDPQTIDEISERIRYVRQSMGPNIRPAGRTRLTDRYGMDPNSNAVLEQLSPISGKSNPVACGLVFKMTGPNTAQGEALLNELYEGPINCVHGGVICSLFDEFIGMLESNRTGTNGFVGTISVKFIKPTPLNTPIILKGWVDSTTERKSFLKGEMWAGQELTATCDVICIRVRPEVIEDLRTK